MTDLSGPAHDAMVEQGVKAAVAAFNRAVTMYLTLRGNTFEARDELAVLIAAHAAPAPDEALTGGFVTHFEGATAPDLFG